MAKYDDDMSLFILECGHPWRRVRTIHLRVEKRRCVAGSWFELYWPGNLLLSHTLRQE